MCANRFETERFGDANEALTDVSVKIGNLFVLMFPVIGMILHLSTAAVLWFGGQRVDAGQMQVGSLTAFLQYLLQILMAVMMGIFMAMMIPRAVVCADRIGEVLAVAASIDDPQQAGGTAAAGRRASSSATSPSAIPGAEKPVLSDVSFTAEPGQTTAIIGSTGAGKSTLVSLLAAASTTPQQGRCCSTASRSPSWTRATTRRARRPWSRSGRTCSPAPSRTTCASASPEATDDGTLGGAARRPGRGLRPRKKHGLDARIAQGGTNVSGGQRQRLCIARAAGRPSPRSSCSTTRSPR